ncbi:hypothetical protein [Paraburkholderia sp. 22B1P]|uniref:hypothetical protein n=1 Tax=Paraburkholderia sp. 22B1P TaxID=3080498 RepID=UPI00308A4F34|nr:hypothetical protein PBP221_01370 [Paraburkholderia sp. 22B1P]
MQAVGCTNPNQFGAWINRESERLGWPDTQSSNKWYHLIAGKLKKPPADALRKLSQLFPHADKLFNDGPANLWRALWGDVRDPNTLWPLCRSRFFDYAPLVDEITYEIEAEFFNERTFHETIRMFEWHLIAAMKCKLPLTLNHLTEAIALYRLHQAINCLAVSDVDGVGAYRCIQHCLSDLEIRSQLNEFDGYHIVRDELVKMEVCRLTTEQSYFESVGIQRHDVLMYAMDPLSWIDDGARWKSLNLDWAPASAEEPGESESDGDRCYYCTGDWDPEWGCKDNDCGRP